MRRDGREHESSCSSPTTRELLTSHQDTYMTQDTFITRAAQDEYYAKTRADEDPLTAPAGSKSDPGDVCHLACAA